jgi:hypothetical protein
MVRKYLRVEQDAALQLCDTRKPDGEAEFTEGEPLARGQIKETPA